MHVYNNNNLDFLCLLLHGGLMQFDDVFQLLIPFQQSLAKLRCQLKICAKYEKDTFIFI